MKKLLKSVAECTTFRICSRSDQLLIFILTVLTSCGQPQSVSTENIIKKSKCYIATFEKDTVETKIEYNGKKISGTMRMSYKNGHVCDGIIKGTIHGDTLILKYDFKIDNVNTWYQNPIALLNRDGQLIMGVGKINIAWGTGIFDNSIPIDYEKGKFIFSETNCITR